MKPTMVLPERFEKTGTLDLSQNKRLALSLQIAAVLLFVVSVALFVQLTLLLRQEDELVFSFDADFATLFGFVLVLVLTGFVHEAVHGVCFWRLTKDVPKFGFKLFYAYAAAPGWYLPRSNYFVIALAPAVAMTIAGIVFIPFVTTTVLPFLLAGLILNFAGSVGDLAVVAWLLGKRQAMYINDYGDGVTIYGQVPRSIDS